MPMQKSFKISQTVFQKLEFCEFQKIAIRERLTGHKMRYIRWCLAQSTDIDAALVEGERSIVQDARLLDGLNSALNEGNVFGMDIRTASRYCGRNTTCSGQQSRRQ